MNKSLHPSATDGTRQDRRTETAILALRAIIKDAYIEKFGPQPPLSKVELDLKLVLEEGWRLSFKEGLRQQLEPQLENLEAQGNAFKQGTVYCYLCQTNHCEHSQPHSPLEVFTGYHALGTPIWKEFSQAMLDFRDERIDQLYGSNPITIARILTNDELKQRQLAPFGKDSKTFSVLAEIIVGYFLRRDIKDELEEKRLAFTFQAVELRQKNGLPRFELNSICYLPPNGELSDLIHNNFDWVQRARKKAQTNLKRLQEQHCGQGAKQDSKQRGNEIMKQMASELARGQRQSQRQTKHAHQRRQIHRPIDKAMADLGKARLERMFFDKWKNTIVLCADKGRCHIFSELGKHITSFTILPDEINARVSRNRWLSLEKGQFQSFMANINPGQEP